MVKSGRRWVGRKIGSAMMQKKKIKGKINRFVLIDHFTKISRNLLGWEISRNLLVWEINCYMNDSKRRKLVSFLYKSYFGFKKSL